MSPSRRRATARCAVWHPAPVRAPVATPAFTRFPFSRRPCALAVPPRAPRGRAHRPCGLGVRPVSGALEVTERRALRGYRGRTETPPAKLSACATCHAYGTLPTRGAHGGAMGTSRPTAITPAYFRTRIARGGSPPRAARWSAAGPPGSRPTAITPAIFARAPYRVRTAITHDHGARRITRRAQWSCPNVRFAHTNRGCVIRHFG